MFSLILASILIFSLTLLIIIEIYNHLYEISKKFYKYHYLIPENIKKCRRNFIIVSSSSLFIFITGNVLLCTKCIGFCCVGICTIILSLLALLGLHYYDKIMEYHR